MGLYCDCCYHKYYYHYYNYYYYCYYYEKYHHYTDRAVAGMRVSGAVHVGAGMGLTSEGRVVDVMGEVVPPC